MRLDEEPRARTDPLTGASVLEVHWGTADALPFPLRVWQFDDGVDDTGTPRTKYVSLARGNVVLADHGRTVPSEPLVPPRVPAGRRYRPTMRRGAVTQSLPYLHAAARVRPAGAAFEVDLRRVRPSVLLEGEDEIWVPQRDLLNSDRFAPEFVLEPEADGRAQLRFGDGVVGRRPAEGATFSATYRVGSGQAGNAGADSLTRIVAGEAVRTIAPGIAGLRNPLPAAGGTDPELVEQVRLYAPQAFRTQQRAVTAGDYAAAAQGHPQVQRAAATRRWTGSWYTVFLTVDRRGGLPVDAFFEFELRKFLEPLRLAGHDLEVDGPRFVPLDVVLTVCLRPGYDRSTVKQALLETFGTIDLPDGRRGFFHPDNFTFGQPVYLSQVIAAVMQVPGVHWVDADDTPPRPNRFQRWGRLSRGERAAGRIELGRLEIARLDNDPNQPENGRLDFIMRGGV